MSLSSPMCSLPSSEAAAESLFPVSRNKKNIFVSLKFKCIGPFVPVFLAGASVSPSPVRQFDPQCSSHLQVTCSPLPVK